TTSRTGHLAEGGGEEWDETRHGVLPLERGAQLAGEGARGRVAAGDQQAVGSERGTGPAAGRGDRRRAHATPFGDRRDLGTGVHRDAESAGARGRAGVGARVDDAGAV